MRLRAGVPAACLLVLVLGWVPACLGEPDEEQETSREPIIHGSIDRSDDAVVALTVGGEEFCSGTLVSPRTVITAGHCLRETGYVPQDIEVAFGTTVGGATTVLGCTAGGAHPSWYVDDDGAPIHDVAYLTLDHDAPVSPVAWRSTALPDLVGQSVRLVGYGVTSARRQSGSGTRRTVLETIADQDRRFLYYGNGETGTCQGDSGGPMFLDGDGAPVLIAVTSYGDRSCVELGASTRVDTYASFLSRHITGNRDPEVEGVDEGEPNDRRSEALVVDRAGRIVGTIDSRDVDYFKMSVPQGRTLSVRLGTPSDTVGALRLYNGRGVLVEASENEAEAARSITWSNAATSPRVIYVEVRGGGAAGPYELGLSW
jgi:V8-like Glu-specific endopeptidase